MAAPTLKDEHRVSLLEWLCQGLSDAEIIANLESTYGVTCTAQNLTYYRVKWAEEIDESEQRKLDAAKRRGWGLASKRASVLMKVLDKFEGVLDYASPGQITQAKLGQEYRETVAELRRELGQDKPNRLELTGANGGPVQTQAVGVGEVLTSERAIAAACALEEALAAPGDTDPGGPCAGTD